MQALPGEGVVQLRDARLVLDGRVGEGLGAIGFARVLAAPPVDVEQGFRLKVVGVEGVVAERPRRRDAGAVTHRAKILAAQADEGRTVDLRIAADIVMHGRVEGLAGAVAPHLLDAIASLAEDRLDAPVVDLALQVLAALEDQDTLAGRCQLLRERTPAGPAADHDHVVVVAGHGDLRIANDGVG